MENYEEFEAVLDKLGEEFHYDNESGVDVRGNEVLPWNVKINVQPQTVNEEQLTAIRETLGEEADMMLLCDIHFMDMITGMSMKSENLSQSRSQSEILILKHMKHCSSCISKMTERTST